jgi:transcription antitermination factor NusG
MTNADELMPGDRVRIVDGTFIGLEGTVLTREEARELRDKNGGQEDPLTEWSPEDVYLALPLFGREVPVILLRAQVKCIAR